jgi:nickel/cobalt exporter
LLSIEIEILLWSAASIAFVHAILGPDHYVPFVALAKASDWSVRKTVLMVAACGAGHVAGSVILGGLGVTLGWALGLMTDFETLRGGWAAWLLIAFGLVYGVWGLRKGYNDRPHSHDHCHEDGARHTHEHAHHSGHVHPHTQGTLRSSTPWVLFIAFVLGPCEALIPLLMVPAAKQSPWAVVGVAGVFGLVTILTMLAATFALLHGLRHVSPRPLERWSHALAGLALLASGGAIKWMGL